MIKAIIAVYKLVFLKIKNQTFRLRNFELITRNAKHGTRNVI